MKTTILLMAMILLLMLVSDSSLASNEEQVIQVPKGNPITIDGKLGEDEWKGALRQELVGGGEVRLMHDGTHLLVGVKGMKDGLGHICISDGKDIYVLHASAALGTAIYHRDESDVWKLVQPFKFEMRDRSQSQEAVAARNAYLASNGWVATTFQMGNPGEIEFKLSTKFKQGEVMKLAVVFASPPSAGQYWPKAVSDDCLKQTLIFGPIPAELKFKPESWARVKMQ